MEAPVGRKQVCKPAGKDLISLRAASYETCSAVGVRIPGRSCGCYSWSLMTFSAVNFVGECSEQYPYGSQDITIIQLG